MADHHLMASLQDTGSQQIGFLLGSCGVTVALTSDACHKGLPKSPTGEIPQFKGDTHITAVYINCCCVNIWSWFISISSR